jgi:tRNA (mo5U34)-methyltransferase
MKADVDDSGGTFVGALKERVEAEPYWFHQIDLGDGVVTPGWSNPARDKLPLFGLPDDMTGMRVLDVGCAEGFFSFEAERRGAAEVVSLDFDAECIKRFRLCAEALDSRVTHPEVHGVYELDPNVMGTFDLVMFFGLLYHLRHPLLGIEKVAAMTSGQLLLQSWALETSRLSDQPLARFQAHGLMSGPKENRIHDPTVYWEPNAACMRDMLEHVGLVDIEQLPGLGTTTRERLVRRLRPRTYSTWNGSAQFRAHAATQAPGRAAS